jgi:hypothetical protein
MKLNPQHSIPQQTSNYVHPWDEYVSRLDKPNPPTKEAVKKAQFKDKTYHWTGR